MGILALRTRLAQLLMGLPDEKFMEVYQAVSPLLDEEKLLKPKSRSAGLMKGLVINMDDDFDELLDDFRDYIPE